MAVGGRLWPLGGLLRLLGGGCGRWGLNGGGWVPAVRPLTCSGSVRSADQPVLRRSGRPDVPDAGMRPAPVQVT